MFSRLKNRGRLLAAVTLAAACIFAFGMSATPASASSTDDFTLDTNWQPWQSGSKHFDFAMDGYATTADVSLPLFANMPGSSTSAFGIKLDVQSYGSDEKTTYTYNYLKAGGAVTSGAGVVADQIIGDQWGTPEYGPVVAMLNSSQGGVVNSGLGAKTTFYRSSNAVREVASYTDPATGEPIFDFEQVVAFTPRGVRTTITVTGTKSEPLTNFGILGLEDTDFMQHDGIPVHYDSIPNSYYVPGGTVADRNLYVTGNDGVAGSSVRTYPNDFTGYVDVFNAAGQPWNHTKGDVAYNGSDLSINFVSSRSTLAKGDSKSLTYTVHIIYPGVVTVHYVDEAGKPIADDTKVNGPYDGTYSVKPQDIAKYSFKEAKGDPQSGKFEDKDKTITYVYAPILDDVKYDGNGADSGSVAAQSGMVSSNLTVAQNGFKRTGYTFSGWNTAADGSGDAYKAGASLTLPSAAGAVTLYAQWTKNATPAEPVPPQKPGTASHGKHTQVQPNLAKTGSNVMIFAVATLLAGGVGLALQFAKRHRAL